MLAIRVSTAAQHVVGQLGDQLHRAPEVRCARIGATGDVIQLRAGRRWSYQRSDQDE